MLEEVNKGMELLIELRKMMLVATGIKEIEIGPTDDIESIKYKELRVGGRGQTCTHSGRGLNEL